MAANSKKKLKLRSGCYVHKLVDGQRDALNTVFECSELSETKCKINNLFSPNPKSIKTAIKSLIPQTLVYYHKDCKKHAPLNTNSYHPENPHRVSIPTKFLKDYGLLQKCVVLKPKEVTTKQLLLTHTQSHVNKIASTQQMSQNYRTQTTQNSDIKTNVSIISIPSATVQEKTDNDGDADMYQKDLKTDQNENDNQKYQQLLLKYENGDDFDMDDNDSKSDVETSRIGWFNMDTFYNEYSHRAARLACGAAIGLVKNILNNRCVNGIAIVRPPGHHCERDAVMGFCLYNNVSVAVNVIKQRRLCKKILIVDWDLHHGNGTQNMFMTDEDVLYFSVHRHDNGFFYPSTGKIAEDGQGFNVNVPLNRVNCARYGDAAYMDIWKCVLIPIALEFQPEIIIISAGFDACIQDPINEDAMAISPPCYGVLCRMLMNVCSKVAVVLEGGYQLNTMCPAIAYVTWALLRGSIDDMYKYQSLETYNQSEIQLYVENTLWYKSVFFEFEFKRFVLDKLDSAQINFDLCYKCTEEYDVEQQQDLTKTERRRIMKNVLTQHGKYWTFLQSLRDYFKTKY